MVFIDVHAAVAGREWQGTAAADNEVGGRSSVDAVNGAYHGGLFH